MNIGAGRPEGIDTVKRNELPLMFDAAIPISPHGKRISYTTSTGYAGCGVEWKLW